MKSKGGGGLFGIFKKKTTPAPVAPVAQTEGPREVVNVSSSSSSTDTNIEHVEMDVVLPQQQPRKGSIAKTSVIHYSPPGTVRTSLPPSSAPSSVTSGDTSVENQESAVVITRKSNIVLDDEESVVSTPISQYDESPIVHKPRKKRTAAPPPPASAPVSSPPPPTSHYRQTSTMSTDSSIPPVLPPHRSKKEDQKDYEGMLKNLQTKFDEWNQARIEEGGSVREERIKAEVLKEHEKLKVLLEKEIKTPKKVSTAESPVTRPANNNNYVKMTPKPVPGGTVYQKAPQIPKPKTTDENRNEIRYSDPGTGKNSAAVDRLRKEVEEQRQREREVKQYRNPKTMSTESPKVQSPTSPGSGPRMVEYKPMKSVVEVADLPPPIPKTPPPKLADYRNESPRMPTVPQNGYVRLQVGAKKVAAPEAPQVSTKKVPYGLPYTGPEYASSPKLLRKNPVTPKDALGSSGAQKPTKATEIVYQKPQQHPQMSSQDQVYQKVTVPVSSRNPPMSPPILRSTVASPPPMHRAFSQDATPTNFIYQKSKAVQNGYGPSRVTVNGSPQKRSTVASPPPPKPSTPKMTRAYSQDVAPSNFIYQKPTVTSPKPVRSTVFPPKDTVPLSATSPVYQKVTIATSSTPPPPPPPMMSPKPVRKVEVAQPKGIPTATSSRPKVGPTGPVSGPPNTFAISDVLKGPGLRKVGMPVEKSGIGLGKVLDDSATVARPSTVPPPPPPPPIAAGLNNNRVGTQPAGKSDLRDSLMSEIREAGRLRAARTSQNA